MEGCPHCHIVLSGVLPELEARYGDRLEIWTVQVASQEDFAALIKVAETYGLPREAVGVPLLVLGDRVLIGSLQIPEELPGLVEYHLRAGGLALPDNEIIREFIASGRAQPFVLEDAAETPTRIATPSATEPAPESPVDPPHPPEPQVPPNGYGLAIGVLVGMLAALVYGLVVLLRATHTGTIPLPPAAWERAVPWLALAGMAVAAYLAYVETLDVRAVCGPIGDCNAVQHSPYARFLGLIPVGWMGLVGYAAILAVWALGKSRRGGLAEWCSLALFGFTAFGLLFSIYLTYLEPFVIRAVCLWCLSSSVIITLLFLLSLRGALEISRKGQM
jgi:uncharacterized membrane protein